LNLNNSEWAKIRSLISQVTRRKNKRKRKKKKTEIFVTMSILVFHEDYSRYLLGRMLCGRM
jgi:hypothetical protein